MLVVRAAGYRIRRARAGRDAEAVRPQVNVVVAATLALLALLLGFSLTIDQERAKLIIGRGGPVARTEPCESSASPMPAWNQ